jgi:Delta7-sterol 5-desaturase
MELEARLAEARNHPSHPRFVVGDWAPFGPEHTFLNDYVSQCVVTLVVAIPFYLFMSSMMYLVYFRLFKNTFSPRYKELRFQKEPFWHDLKWSLLNIVGQTPLISLVRMGYPYYSKVQYEWSFTPMTVFYLIFHVCYDEFFTYWGHRLLHKPFLYRHLHSIHHTAKSVTPFTGFAFHPLDAFAQALPVFTSCYFVPIHINIVLAHGLATSLWAFSIHDNVNAVPFKGILYAGSHSIHHFPWGENYNYGKFTSICDRLYGTYCDPEGITGYGYHASKSWKGFLDIFNWYYAKLIPDNGEREIGKYRKIYGKKV